MPGNHWTDEEVELAQTLHDAGKTYHVIARSLPGRSPESIRHIVSHRFRRGSVKAPAADNLLHALAVSITRFANDNAISMPEALNRLLYAGEAR